MKEIQRVIRNVQPHWVGDGFPVRSLFSYNAGNDFDPFLLLDYAGPYTFTPADAKRGVGEHPHRGFETVTIVYQGEVEHRDSSGSHGLIGPGDVQWMTAASGVVHEEFHGERFTREGGTLEMVQLWVNLPAKSKMSSPSYQAILNEEIPQVPLASGAGLVRVIAGDFAGTAGSARTHTPINLWDVQLNANCTTEFNLPHGHTSLVVVQTGDVRVNEATLGSGDLALFVRESESERVDLHAESAVRLLILTGEPLQEPVVGQGPFVMNTREEIQSAIQDYRAGRMGHL